MSNLTNLTWDNMDQFIDSLPKDENGHFLQNPKAKQPIAVEINPLDIPTADLVAPLKKILQRISDFAKTAIDVLLDVLPTQMVDTLIEDGFITDKELWLSNVHFDHGNKNILTMRCDGGHIEIRLNPTNDPKESLIKVNHNKLYIKAFPKTIFENTNEGLTVTKDGKSINFPNLVAEDTSKLFPEVKKADPEILNEAQRSLVDLTLNNPDIPEQSKQDLVEKLEGTPLAVQKTTVTNETLMERAKANLETLDTAEAEKEFDAQIEGMKRSKEIVKTGMVETINSPLTNPNMTPAQLKEWSDANVEKAKSIVAKMDAHLEEGGRVNVADKFLMNCKADLNQLIPFKYSQPWTLYLNSCANHWMPAEMSLERSKAAWDRIGDDSKRLMARAYFTHLSRCNLFPESVLLNLYRLMTNPECRQYMLRQGQESVTVKHAWMEIEDTIQTSKTLIAGVKPSKAFQVDDVVFRERHKAVMEAVKMTHDFTSKTDSAEELAAFVKAFIVLYGYVNWIMPMVAHYQVITTLELNECCDELKQIFKTLNKDGLGQLEFAKFFIEGVVDENPHIATDEWIDDVRRTLRSLVNYEISLVASIQSSENAISDVGYICHHYVDELMLLIDPKHQRTPTMKDSQRGQDFVRSLTSVKPDMHQASGLGGIQW